MRPTVLLYDIDGTLVSTSGIGRRAIERAFERRFGRRDCVAFPFDGMTDRAIVSQGLGHLGLALADAALEAAIDETIAVYLGTLAEEARDTSQFHIHAGMVESLDAASARAGFAVGLGTGNVVEGARIKLGAVGLYERFPFGGFGSDHILRPTLIRIGAERGAARLGVPVDVCRVVIIGDTPRDIDAARAIGAESVGVGTGSYSAEALRGHGATHAFASLAEPGALAAVLGDRA